MEGHHARLAPPLPGGMFGPDKTGDREGPRHGRLAGAHQRQGCSGGRGGYLVCLEEDQPGAEADHQGSDQSITGWPPGI